MNQKELIKFSKLSRLIGSNSEAEDVDFISVSDINDIVNMIMEVQGADVSSVTQEDIDALRIVRQAPMRDDVVTEAVNTDATAHVADKGYCGYFKILQVVGEE